MNGGATALGHPLDYRSILSTRLLSEMGKRLDYNYDMYWCRYGASCHI